MGLSDNIAVIEHGKLLQQGTGPELYYRPRTKQVSDFTGSANYFGNVMVRNEWFTLEENEGMKFSGTVVSKTFLGKTTRIKVKSDSSSIGMFCAEIETSKAEGLSAGKNVVFYAENVVTF